MDPVLLVLIIVTAVASLLFLVLKLKIHSFTSLVLVSIDIFPGRSHTIVREELENARSFMIA